MLVKSEICKMNDKSISEDFLKYKTERNGDPLACLDQLDDDCGFQISEEALVLIRRLIYTIEEFYLLKEMIKGIIKDDEDEDIASRDYFKTLVREVRKMYVSAYPGKD